MFCCFSYFRISASKGVSWSSGTLWGRSLSILLLILMSGVGSPSFIGVKDSFRSSFFIFFCIYFFAFFKAMCSFDFFFSFYLSLFSPLSFYSSLWPFTPSLTCIVDV